MQVVLFREEFVDLLFSVGRKQCRIGRKPFNFFQNFVALNMDFSVHDEHQNKASGVDTKKPRAVILRLGEIDEVGRPVHTLYAEYDPSLLGAR